MPPWVGVVIAIVSAIVFPAIGLAVSWGALGQRLRALEALPTRVEDINRHLLAIDSRTAASAAGQGARLEVVKTGIDRLEGQMVGFERGVVAGRRSKTAAHGHVTGGKDE